MEGFSLGGGSRHREGEGEGGGIQPESLFLYGGFGFGSGRTQDIASARGFELWQHQIERQHHHRCHLCTGLLSFSDEPFRPGVISRSTSMRGTGGGGMSCQDCGNQAKKDCVHLRCRTCCKSRGFQCATHIKSTWVPAVKRRERQQQLAAAALQYHSHRLRIGGAARRDPTAAGGDGSNGGGGEASKRPREIVSRLPTAIAAATSSGGGRPEAASFPAEVTSPAVFRCVRVSPMDDADDQFAYQTAVSISGHIFRGILYDHGPEVQYSSKPRGESSSSTAAASITTAAAISAASLTAPSATSAGLLDAPTLYPTPLSAFMAGTQFFPPHPRPT